MQQTRQTQIVVLRGLAFLATLGVAWWASGFTKDGPILRSVLIGYAAFFLVSSLLASRHYRTTAVPLLLLLGDLIAIGAVGAWLHDTVEPQVAFLAGYVVAALVAVVGRSVSAAILGTLAGAMTMGLTVTLFATLRQEAPDLLQLASQVVLLAAGGMLAASVTGWLEAETRRRQLAERLDQAIREREAEAAELVTFAQGLAASSSLHEVAEAVIRHLRCYFQVRGRAVALEVEGAIVGLWEENGRLTEDHVERRRGVLQAALAKVGNRCELPRLEARSASSRILPASLDFNTVVEVPIRANGRVAGVLLLADPHRGVLDEGRISVVADVARRVGMAVQRIEYQGTEEHRRTALLLRQMREGVMMLGNDGRILLANPSARAALGCPGADAELPTAIGELTLEELANTPAGVSRRFRARMHHAPAHRATHLSCTAVGILDGAKRMGTLVTLSDVTEEELARTRLLRSEKMTLVGQTLAGVAHELNNPLTALMGYTDLLKMRELPEKLSTTLDKIREQALRATRIVKNLLSVARQRKSERSPVDLGEVASSVVELFAYEARLNNVHIDLEIEESRPKVLGDPHALQQIYVNLVQNAIHALKEYDAGPRHIRIKMEVLPDVVLSTVTDSGTGIPRDLRTRIFEPFFTTKGADKGTGLGLALSRTVARDHEGDLILDEGRGDGARFVLRLPRMQIENVEKTPGAEAPGQQSLELRVLIVDDERAVRDALAAQLGGMGCQVTSTESASAAMRKLAEAEFDALLVDVRMPETSGVDFHNLLAQNDPLRAGRMVFMTGDFTNEEILDAVRATGRRLLEKPFTIDELRSALWEHVPRRPQPPASPPPAARPPRPGREIEPATSETSSEALNRVLKLD